MRWALPTDLLFYLFFSKFFVLFCFGNFFSIFTIYTNIFFCFSFFLTLHYSLLFLIYLIVTSIYKQNVRENKKEIFSKDRQHQTVFFNFLFFPFRLTNAIVNEIEFFFVMCICLMFVFYVIIQPSYEWCV